MAINALVNLSDAAAGWGTITYNGYTFPGIRDVQVYGEPVYDKAGRTIVEMIYTARIHWFISSADAAAHVTAMYAMQRQLGEAGQAFTMSGLATGYVFTQDMQWGPKPGPIQMTQIGDIAHELTWEVKYAIKITTGSYGLFKSFNYSVEWNYDDDGLATRVISGTYEIVAFRNAGGRTVSISADRYRDQLVCYTPPGFRKGPRKFRLSDDRTAMDFTFVDRQLDAEAPPPGAVKCELDYDIENVGIGFAQFIATLSGVITVPQGTPTAVAAQAFISIMADKIAKLKKAGEQVIPLRLRMGRSLGTRRSQFSAAWKVTGCIDLFTQGGIWEDITASNWQNWAKSMEVAWSNRGNSNLYFNESSDAIIDVGYSGNLPQLGTGGGVNLPQPPKNGHIFEINVNEKNSWLEYKNTLKAQRSYRLIEHEPAVESTTSSGAAGPGVRFPPVVASVGATVQTQGPPQDYILMHGKGLRIAGKDKKFMPEVPKLLTIGGKRVVEVKVVTDGPTLVACFFGSPVYSLRWAILYRVVDGYIGDIPERKNPVLCCDDEAEKQLA